MSLWEKKREEMVSDRTAELLSGKLSGQENYNPYLPDNMAELMQEIGSDWVTRLCDLCITSKSGTSFERDRKEQEIGMLFMDYAEQYWEERAEDKAEEDTPSLEELDEDARQEASDARREYAREYSVFGMER